jgi:hypothetical protein
MYNCCWRKYTYSTTLKNERGLCHISILSRVLWSPWSDYACAFLEAWQYSLNKALGVSGLTGFVPLGHSRGAVPGCNLGQDTGCFRNRSRERQLPVWVPGSAMELFILIRHCVTSPVETASLHKLATTKHIHAYRGDIHPFSMARDRPVGPVTTILKTLREIYKTLLAYCKRVHVILNNFL